MARILFSCILASALGAGTVWAHHETNGRAHQVATVTISQQVLAGGQPLAPGTYEIWIGTERPEVGAGAPSTLQRRVQFVQNGKVVREEIAEVFPPAERTDPGVGTTAEVGAVGTSGAAGPARARVQTLRSGEFLRVSITDGGVRYLIHLPTGPLNEPEPQPQTPSRLELPPRTTPAPSPGQAPASQPQTPPAPREQ